MTKNLGTMDLNQFLVNYHIGEETPEEHKFFDTLLKKTHAKYPSLKGNLDASFNKEGKDSGRRMLGCTNYKPDGSGCDCTLMQEENTLESITRNPKNYNGTSIENCCLCEYPVKDLLKIISYAYSSTTDRGINLSITGISKFIIGSKEPFITKLGLDKEKVYGLINESRIMELTSVQRDLLDRHFLEEIGDEYHSVKRTDMPITDELARAIFEDYLFTNKK